MNVNQDVYKTYELEPGCLAIEEENVRSFLFTGKEKSLLVDTGFGGGDLRRLVESLTDKPLLVVNTHADRDHIGANNQFKEILMHPAEYDRYWQNFGAGTEPKGNCPGGSPDCPAIVSLWEQDILDIGGRSFEVFLIPGHTPGSIALLDEKNGILVGGDTVQDGNVFMFKGGRSLPAYIESLKKLRSLAYAGRFNQVYSSHGTAVLPAGIIDQLIEDAAAVLESKVENAEGFESEMFGVPVVIYRMKAAGFICDR